MISMDRHYWNSLILEHSPNVMIVSSKASVDCNFHYSLERCDLVVRPTLKQFASVPHCHKDRVLHPPFLVSKHHSLLKLENYQRNYLTTLPPVIVYYWRESHSCHLLNELVHLSLDLAHTANFQHFPDVECPYNCTLVNRWAVGSITSLLTYSLADGYHRSVRRRQWSHCRLSLYGTLDNRNPVVDTGKCSPSLLGT